jgi:hypothetical protein
MKTSSGCYSVAVVFLDTCCGLQVFSCYIGVPKDSEPRV